MMQIEQRYIVTYWNTGENVHTLNAHTAVMNPISNQARAFMTHPGARSSFGN